MNTSPTWEMGFREVRSNRFRDIYRVFGVVYACLQIECTHGGSTAGRLTS